MRSTRYLLAPSLATGWLMAIYLLLRPYGDSQAGTPMASAFASDRWVTAHMCGAMGLAAFAWSTLRLSDMDPSGPARWARGAGLLGAALVLPYFGAESFGLHALGVQAHGGDLQVLDLVNKVRYEPVAITMFGVGLMALAVSGVAFALAWSRLHVGLTQSWFGWPLAVLISLFLPQFFLPEWARMIFGVSYLGAACLFAALCHYVATDPPSPAQTNPASGSTPLAGEVTEPKRDRCTRSAGDLSRARR